MNHDFQQGIIPMQDVPSHSRPAAAAQARYRTLWRWHFYAGLFVMPFLVVLAITGTLYCFQPQIEPLLYPHRLIVQPATGGRLDDAALLARAAAAMPPGSRVVTAHIDRRPRRSAEFVFQPPGGDRQSVYVNPYTGHVLGTLSVDRRFMQIDRMIHRKLLLGKPGELLMELAACWTLVLIGTGIALWWPRGAFRLRGALWPGPGLRGRSFWRSLHAVMGAWLAVGAIAFIVTGLPWTGSWGKHFKALATDVHLGAPRGAWGATALRSAPPDSARRAAGGTGTAESGGTAGVAAPTGAGMGAMPGMVMDDLPLARVPWAVGDTPVPESRPETGHAGRLSLDRIVAVARERGLASGYDVAFPASPEGVFTVSYSPADPKDERTLHIDQYSGKVLEDIDYHDYGAVSKAVSYGVSLHMGRYLGLANQLVCAAIALGLAAMAITGAVMWWLRRPRRGLGAPSRPPSPAAMRRWKAGLIVLGVVFPLMGGSMAVVWALDRMVFRRKAAA
jgi:uncharacterized iron-regulated membrane protein